MVKISPGIIFIIVFIAVLAVFGAALVLFLTGGAADIVKDANEYNVIIL